MKELTALEYFVVLLLINYTGISIYAIKMLMI